MTPVPSPSRPPNARLWQAPDQSGVALVHLQKVIHHAAHLLPAQGPITVFIHHNTLHAFEKLTFAEAVKKGAEVFGCEPYLTEDRYREELWRGRIRFTDLEEVLRHDLGARADETLAGLSTRIELRLGMLQYPLQLGPTAELLWFMAETDALRRVRSDASAAVRGRLVAETRRWVMRDIRDGNQADPSGNGAPRRRNGLTASLTKLIDRFGEASIETWSEKAWEAFTLQALWRICCHGVMPVPQFAPPPTPPLRHRDLLRQATGMDPDLLVNDLLIRFCPAFLDQGVAHWQLPRREEGFFRAFRALYGPPDRLHDGWLAGLAAEPAMREENVDPLASIHESLEALGVAEAEWEEYISATLLALRGWAGIIWFLEECPDRAVHPVPRGSLIEYLAVRLILDRLALAYTAQNTIGFTGPLSSLRDVLLGRIRPPQPPSPEQRAFPVFQLAQVFGWTPQELYQLSPAEWTVLVEEIEAFSVIERRRIYHLAYERRFTTRVLDAVALHPPAPIPKGSRPRFQTVFCLDEREESMRRHLEEVAPDVQTFGAAGFFAVAIYYRGAADAHFVPLCPIVLKPKHWVTEQVMEDVAHVHQRRARARRALGTASHQIHIGSRTFALGAVLAACGGVLASVPLVARILWPRLTARLRQLFGRLVEAPPATRLQLERSEPACGPANGQLGYSLDEMTDIGERQLRDIGLTDGFARLVFFFGHGSFSLNNPHKSAYDCGACGGSPGAANGRALAQILNDGRVRERLARRGLRLPDDTVFVGGLHNTCNDCITMFDLDRVPASHQAELEAVRRDLEAALDRNAHERCRRFMSAPLTLTAEAARQHVEARSEDLAQTRPELGHATNAICMVGRRERTRGLYLDRRCFLTCYDPTQDDADSTILTRLLSAAVPVCGGINLEYYFSHVDSTGWGCGTKLPHNLTALIGVMDGMASDLRTGLPWQMVEIHEPVRLLFIIETTPARMLRIMDRNPGIALIIRNDWVQLAVLDPHSSAIQVYRNGVFEDYRPEATHLPKAASSAAWYRGWRDHLEFAEIQGP